MFVRNGSYLDRDGETLAAAHDPEELYLYGTDRDVPLTREEVAELVKHLQAWLETGSLEVKAE